MSNSQLHNSGEHPANGAEVDASDPELLFDHLYENYEPLVERWVRRLAGPSADVEDLIHDVFVVALRRRSEFRGDAKVSTWLFRITEFVVRKRRFRRKLRQCLDVLHRSQEIAVVTPSPTPLDSASIVRVSTISPVWVWPSTVPSGRLLSTNWVVYVSRAFVRVC